MKSALNWKVGLWWSLATIGGLILGLVILLAGLGAAINNASPFVFGLVLGCTFGFGCAIMQWVALRHVVSPWWITATFAGWAIFWAGNSHQPQPSRLKQEWSNTRKCCSSTVNE